MEKIKLLLIQESDAEFVLELRNKPFLKNFISPTKITVQQQEEWIQNYKQREQKKMEYYFIVINNEMNEPCGTVRIYDINYQNHSATWGSFILDPERRPEKSAYEVIEKSLAFCFENLGLQTINLDVKAENKKAIYIYEKVGFQYSHRQEDTLYYTLEK